MEPQHREFVLPDISAQVTGLVSKSVGVGDQVLYVLPNGQSRPAIVTATNGASLANLMVMLDGHNDKSINEGFRQGFLTWVESKQFSLNKEPGTWHTQQ